ncbi:flagellar basal body rod protein FlgF [Vibrio sp. PNB22_3_1]
MNPILFNAAKGAERAMHAQHARANNIANAETVGFKAVMEFTTPQRLGGAGFDTSVTTRTNLSLNDFTTGQLMHTGDQLNVAISGQGFFTVLAKDGVTELYTRSGEMNVGPEGDVLIHGRPVLTDGGPLVLPEFESVSISQHGVVSVTPPGGGLLDAGQLKLVSPALSDVTLDETGLFRSKDGEPFEVAAEPIDVRSGYLEGSNVSSFNELVGIMNLTRQFEVQVKVMSKADELARIGNELLSS